MSSSWIILSCLKLTTRIILIWNTLLLHRRYDILTYNSVIFFYQLHADIEIIKWFILFLWINHVDSRMFWLESASIIINEIINGMNYSHLGAAIFDKFGYAWWFMLVQMSTEMKWYLNSVNDCFWITRAAYWSTGFWNESHVRN